VGKKEDVVSIGGGFFEGYRGRFLVAEKKINGRRRASKKGGRRRKGYHGPPWATGRKREEEERKGQSRMN